MDDAADWTCSCTSTNPLDDSKCYTCGAPRPAAATGSAAAVSSTEPTAIVFAGHMMTPAGLGSSKAAGATLSARSAVDELDRVLEEYRQQGHDWLPTAREHDGQTLKFATYLDMDDDDIREFAGADRDLASATEFGQAVTYWFEQELQLPQDLHPLEQLFKGEFNATAVVKFFHRRAKHAVQIVDAAAAAAHPPQGWTDAGCIEQPDQQPPWHDEQPENLEFVRRADLAGLNKTKVIFMRPAAQEVLKVLREGHGKNHNVTMQGCPGTGKSTITWLWATEVQKTKRVRWISFVTNCVVDLCEGAVKRCKFRPSDDVYALFVADFEDVLVIDGLLQQHQELFRFVISNSKERTKTVLLSSGSLKLPIDAIQDNSFCILTMPMWTEKEYRDAYAQEHFQKQLKVESVLPGSLLPDAAPVSNPNNEAGPMLPHASFPQSNEPDLLKAKFDIAGGSARWMFFREPHEVRDAIRLMILEVENLMQLLSNPEEGASSRNAKNHLRGAVSGDPPHYSVTNADQNFWFTSQLVARELARKCEVDIVEFCRRMDWVKNNPSVQGWLTEFAFLAKLKKAHGSPNQLFQPLRHSTGRLAEQASAEQVAAPEQWHITHIQTYWPEDKTQFELKPGLLIIPDIWNQGAFDAVFVREYNRDIDGIGRPRQGWADVDVHPPKDIPALTVLFLQVTRASTHGIKGQYILEFLKRCSFDADKSWRRHLFVAVVPSDCRFDALKPDPVCDQVPHDTRLLGFEGPSF